MAFPGIFNPAMPFTGTIPGGMHDNKSILIEGFIPINSDGFVVDLQIGLKMNDRSSVPIHINPVFSQGQIIRNSLMNNKLAKPETHGGLGGLLPGHPFNMMILCQPKSFMIAINGQHFTEFKHRMNKAHAKNLVINGAVQITSIQYQIGSVLKVVQATHSAASVPLVLAPGQQVISVSSYSPAQQPQQPQGQYPYANAPQNQPPPYPSQAQGPPPPAYAQQAQPPALYPNLYPHQQQQPQVATNIAVAGANISVTTTPTAPPSMDQPYPTKY